ncbi:MAG: hypothetical protein LBP27_02850 [Treponema sp.]|jgi:hypothetical protein|nr:hypothetical protein [Treponema sp.]
MQQKNSSKTSVVSAVIASVCIVVYLAALVFAALRIYAGIERRHIAAEQEFFDLADLASSAGVLGFMDEAFIETINDALASSETLEGVIISGPGGEYAFERERGGAVNWVNNSPRFKERPDFSGQPLYLPLRIQGLRNVTIQAVAGALDYGLLGEVLKQALVMILAALSLSFFTLLIESLAGKPGRRASPESTGFRVRDGGLYGGQPPAVEEKPEPRKAAAPQREESRPPRAGSAAVARDAAKPAPLREETETPRGLYSPHGNIGWEAYTTDRLESELHRCASNEQDLVFISMEFKNSRDLDTGFYNQLAEDTVNFFTLRDLIFERGERGIAVIFPNIDLDTGFAKCEEFHNRILSKYSGILRSKTDLCVGLSSRSGRLIDAERLIFEASEALERALSDPVSHIVAFRSDPEKYRAFIASHKNRL